MARRTAREGARARLYVRACLALARLGKRLGIRPVSEAVHARRKASGSELAMLEANIDLADMDIGADTVLAASKTLAVVTAAGAAASTAAVWFIWGTEYIVPMMFALAVLPILSREAMKTIPASAASKRAAEVLKNSASSSNLMIMSLRHEPSLSKAMRFASRGESEFARELRRSLWEVVMGKHESFEGAVHALGVRWARFSEDLKTSLNAMVTASCESTEEGKRRALDRASSAMVAGAKRRIEEYALSLSTPSMIMFGLGILLPLMVGSFMPMLSWDIWMGTSADQGGDALGTGSVLPQTVFLMNVLFPAIALLVAMDAVSHHPMDLPRRNEMDPRRGRALGAALAVAGTAVLSVLALRFLEGTALDVCLLLSALVPVSVLLMRLGTAEHARSAGRRRRGLEDVLFKTGARMLEGDNFEAALNGAGRELDGEPAEMVRRLSLRTTIAGEGFEQAADEELDRCGDRNVLEGLKIVRGSASKNELSAGMLAMDLAAYLKDLGDLESTLKSRLRPTISMMRMTTHALAPIVLGVTFSIYMSLSSIAGGTGDMSAGSLFLVLGMFLAEINAAVSYFVWGIDGKHGHGALMYSIGSCVLVSELIYIATVVVAS